MSIHSQIMTATFSVSQIGRTREDKGLSAEITARHDMANGAVKVNKRLFPEAIYTPLDQLVGTAGRYHRARVFITPLGHLLTVTDYETWKQEMDKFQREFYNIVESHWVHRWDEHMAAAREMLNGQFDMRWYPAHALDARSKFSFDLVTAPLAKAEHAVLNQLSSFQQEQMRQNYQETLARVEANLKREAAERILENVRHIAEKMSEEKPRLFDSMEEHLNTALNTAAAFTDDRTIRSMVDQCRTTLRIDMERLRISKSWRFELGQKAKNIVNTFGGGAGRKLAA